MWIAPGFPRRSARGPLSALLSEADVAVFTGEYERTGFAAGSTGTATSTATGS